MKIVFCFHLKNKYLSLFQDNLGDRSTMKILVKTLTGKSITLNDIHEDSTIEDVARKIRSEEGIPPDQQRIFLMGYHLNSLEL